MRAAEYAAREAVIILEYDLIRVLSAIIAAEARSMNDPARIVGRIPACASREKRQQTLTLLRTAVSDLSTAEVARLAGNRSSYWLAMRKVFGSDYPWPTW